MEFVSVTCHACNRPITGDYVTFGAGKFHHECFTCASCGSAMAGTQFLVHGGLRYCAGCHEEKFAQRCDICAVAFKPGERQTGFGGKTMHPACFSCTGGCGKSLAGTQFFMEGGSPYCDGCFKGNFAEPCSECSEPLTGAFITLDGGNRKLHRECYKCNECKESLASFGGHFEHQRALYCKQHYVNLTAEKCAECAQPLIGKFVVLPGDKKFHQRCFCCRQCKRSLTGGHYERDGGYYCAQHQARPRPAQPVSGGAAAGGGGAAGGGSAAGGFASLGGVDLEKKKRGIVNAFHVWARMGEDPMQLCVQVLRQKLGCDEASAREVLLQFDTNDDGVFQVDEFVDAVLGLGLDISQATVTEAANVASTAPDGSVYTNSVSTEEAAVLT